MFSVVPHGKIKRVAAMLKANCECGYKIQELKDKARSSRVLLKDYVPERTIASFYVSISETDSGVSKNDL